jgi:hypothetical protein
VSCLIFTCAWSSWFQNLCSSLNFQDLCLISRALISASCCSFACEKMFGLVSIFTRGNTLAIRCLHCDFYFFHRLWHVKGASVLLVFVCFVCVVCVCICRYACMLNVQNTCRHLSRQYFLRFSCKRKKSALHEFAGKKAKIFIVWTSYQKAWHIPLGKKSEVSQHSNIFCTELLHWTELYLWLYECGLAEFRFAFSLPLRKFSRVIHTAPPLHAIKTRDDRGLRVFYR